MSKFTSNNPVWFRFIITIYCALYFGFIFTLSFLLSVIIGCIMFIYTFANITETQWYIGWVFHNVSTLSTNPYLNPFWKIHFHPVSELLSLSQLKLQSQLKSNYDFLPSKKNTPVIVMCNHCSFSDVVIAPRIVFSWQCKYVSKESNFYIPIIGWGMKLAGDLVVRFTKEKGGWGTVKGSVEKLLKESKQTLCEEKTSIFVFPEGYCTGDSSDLASFKAGFFDVAIRAQCPILPVVMVNTERAWPVNSRLWDSADIHVQYGELIYPPPPPSLSNSSPVEDKTKSDILHAHNVEELKKSTSTSMKNMLDHLNKSY